MAFDVDFFVIGAGSGGVRAARIAAGHGAKTVVAEEGRIGGACVIRGCVPKKLLCDRQPFRRRLPRRGRVRLERWRTDLRLADPVKAKDKEITPTFRRLPRESRRGPAPSSSNSARRSSTPTGCDLPTDARSPPAISSSPPARAPLRRPDRGDRACDQLERGFDLPVFPRRLLVVGGGYIAVEFASLFQRWGRRSRWSMRGRNILRGFDEDMRDGMRDAMATPELSFGLAACRPRSRNSPTVVARDAVRRPVIEADQALIATGRTPTPKTSASKRPELN